MKVEIEEISPVKKALRIEVPTEVIAGEFETALSDLKKRVKIPGFRPGKVPLSLIEKRFRQEVHDDIIRKVIPDYYRKAVAQTGIRPVEFPAIDRIELAKDKPLSFTATVEVSPPIVLKDYSGIAVTRKKTEVLEADLDRALAALREDHGELIALAPESEVAEGNYVIIDFEGKIDGKPLTLHRGEAGRSLVTDYLVQVGSKALMAGLEESLVGKRKGDSYSVTLPVPLDHPDESIRGKRIDFSVHVKEVKIKSLPKIDEEFAKDLGLESLIKLRERVKGELQARLDGQARVSERNAVVKKLVEMHQIEVPPSLIEHELEHLLDEAKRANSQIDQQAIESIAAERVKASLLLSAIADAEGIVITDEDLEVEIAGISKRLNLSSHETKRLIQKQEKTLDGLRSRLREDRTLDRILSKAAISVEHA